MSLQTTGGRSGLATAAIVWAALATVASAVGIYVGAKALDEVRDARVVAGETVPVTLTEFKIDPAAIEVGRGSSLAVTNAGTIQHNLAVTGGPSTPLIDSGASDTLDLSGLDEGSYQLTCTVPGHADAGMKATLKVGAAGAGTAAPAGTAKLTAEQIDAETEQSVKQFLANAEKPLTEGLGAQILEPTILPDGTKQFDLVAKKVQWQVAPGKTVEAYAYNGVVPGPTIKVSSGDKLKFVLKNELPESTSIHWHGIIVPNDQDGVPSVTQPPIKPGETYTYEFDAVGPAVGMYHAHQDSQFQVPMGLEGAFYIDDLPLPAGVTLSQPPITMILNDAGNIGFSINGKGFPATAPIVAKTNDWILIHFMNEGLQIHPMHLHGFSGRVIATDGYPDPAPQSWDTVNVAPGQRISMLVKTDMAGAWLLHCHILTHAESEHGYFGMATAMVIQ